ncbi:Coq4 family protein [Candidatus Litorirhabdus singularis]|uniref:Coq4 family protein n=1 Tax=Candidatus Litorirhabdus singularis TaxID=2518993 RepID=UPI00242C38C6|nr:Coq4 family protein [Candidatus Litorirhabdus singularis]
MTAETLKEIFCSQVSDGPDLAAVAQLAADAKKGGFAVDAELRIRVAAMMAHVGFLAPDRTGEVFDAFAVGWLEKPVRATPISTLDLSAGTVRDDLLNAYWSLVEDGVAGSLDAASITERTAGLGGFQNEVFQDRLAQSSLQYPGVKEIAGRSTPPGFKLATLAACPLGSIGRQYHDLIVDNGFDLEVLDGHALGLSKLPPPLDFLNARNLQTHDLWHLVAGYETTVLHEFAIAAFQLAQFGHSYSGSLMAVMTGVAALSPAIGFPILMDAVLTAWVHGRETSPMIGIHWEDSWNLSVEEIRQNYAISPYASPHPANLFELGAA